MNKKILYLIIGTFLIINIVILIKLIKFEKDIKIILDQNSLEESTLMNEITNVYSNMDERLKKQGSILDSYSLTIGDELNKDTFTVPVTITITPKEYKEGLKASVCINDEIISMEKEGTSFTAKTDLYIFNDLNIKIIIEKDGVEKIETIEEVVDLKSKFILKILNGSYSNEKWGFDNISNRFKFNGEIEVSFNYYDVFTLDKHPNNSHKKMTIIKEKNGNIVGEETNWEIGKEDILSFIRVKINDEVILEDEDKLIIYALIEDSYGLIYKYKIVTFEIDNNGNPIEMYYQTFQQDFIEISDKEGNILYNLPR